MARLRAIERVLGVAAMVIYLGWMAHYLYKRNPAVASRVGFYARRTARVARWRVMYPHLPPWAQEAAQVRGLAPVDDDDDQELDLSPFQAESAE